MSITLNATQCPAPTKAITMPLIAGGTTVTASTFTAGETSTVVGKMNRNAVQNDLAHRYGGGSNAVLNGLALTAGTGLSVNVAAGHCIASTIIEVATTTAVAVPASTARAWIWIDESGTFQVVTTTAAPSSNSVLIGSVVTDATSVVSVDSSGVCYNRNGIMFRNTADAGAPGDTPPSAMVLITQTIGGTYMWDGTRYLSLAPAGVINSVGTTTLGFFGATPVVKTAVADPAAITAPASMAGSYTQSEVQQLRNDVVALRANVLALTDALQALGLV